ncbi:MAG: hypothetical protein LBL73_07135 [Synergistaceae bacterium]|nr:hypothetical protein [Synergistaceae bacterium]
MKRSERLNDNSETIRAAIESSMFDMHVSCPGIVESFDPEAKTVSVRPAVRAAVGKSDGTVEQTELPLLVDVPVVFPSAGGFTLTFPVKPGDDCLVVFGDSCMDAWWQNGGVQDPVEFRQHDLSDSFAVFAPISQPHRIPDISTDSVMLRTDDGRAFIGIDDSPVHNITIATPGLLLFRVGHATMEAY